MNYELNNILNSKFKAQNFLFLTFVETRNFASLQLRYPNFFKLLLYSFPRYESAQLAQQVR
jgi:hypothetical protein